MVKLIGKLGDLDGLVAAIAEFSVVPFVGAGCSVGLTAGADWNAVTAVLCAELGIPALDRRPGSSATFRGAIRKRRFGAPTRGAPQNRLVL